jgi:hypothetical protein
MRAAVLHAIGQVDVAEVQDPQIVEPTDAIVRVLVAAICGSDLWPYRGLEAFTPGDRLGHEWIGVVEETGSAVAGLRTGDVVIAPFAFSDGECSACRDGLFTSCARGGFWGGANDGGQGEAVRVPFAESTLVRLGESADHTLSDPAALGRLLPLADVLATGHHAGVLAGVAAGSEIVVVGDGAVGLCAVLAARRTGAERIISVSRHPERGDLARLFGATDVVAAGDDAGERILELTAGGVRSVLECVGNQSALDLATNVVRAGGVIGSVGVPHGVERVDLYRLFRSNITLRAGVAPVRKYLPGLLRDVLAGGLDASPVFTAQVTLDDIAAGYRAMDDRRAIKALVRVDC